MQSGFFIPTAAGVVVQKWSEYILAHTMPRELDRHPLRGVGRGLVLLPVILPFWEPGYTTLLGRVRANFSSVPSK